MNLMAFALLSLHSVSFDQLLPVFLHYPRQENRASDPNVQLPFKFSGGFGLKVGWSSPSLQSRHQSQGVDLTTALHQAERIGLMYTLYGIYGMCIQFLIFPVVARRFGVLTSLKFVCILFPVAYLLTPFSALLPTPAAQQIAIFLVLLLKGGAAIFAFPCMGILLTNSADSLRVLGTLNGVATSTTAVGRAIGPAFEGWTYSVGLNIGYVILPWWTLAVIASLSAIPVWYLVEREGPSVDKNANLESSDIETGEPRPDTNNCKKGPSHSDSAAGEFQVNQRNG